jgi:hypothetical protein
VSLKKVLPSSTMVCDYTEKTGDLFLETMLVRKLAHLWIVRGDETKWERAIERSRKKAPTVSSIPA